MTSIFSALHLWNNNSTSYNVGISAQFRLVFPARKDIFYCIVCYSLFGGRLWLPPSLPAHFSMFAVHISSSHSYVFVCTADRRTVVGNCKAHLSFVIRRRRTTTAICFICAGRQIKQANARRRSERNRETEICHSRMGRKAGDLMLSQGWH